jgi:hypothetical protein
VTEESKRPPAYTYVVLDPRPAATRVKVAVVIEAADKAGKEIRHL